MMELRCPGGQRATMTSDGLLEIPCHSRWCGKVPGVVVLHRFKAETGELVETLRYKAPTKPTNTNTERRA